MSKKSVRYSDPTDIEKTCARGNVIFPKRGIPLSYFLTNYKKMNSLGCTNSTYPTYIDGKYCCGDQMSDQNAFDYVNKLLASAMEKTEAVVFSAETIDFLIRFRNYLKKKPGLVDNISLPEIPELPEHIKDPDEVIPLWISIMTEGRINSKSDPSDRNRSPHPDPLVRAFITEVESSRYRKGSTRGIYDGGTKRKRRSKTKRRKSHTFRNR